MMTEQVLDEMIDDEDLEAALDDLHDTMGWDRLGAVSREGLISHVRYLDRALPGLASKIEQEAVKNAVHRRVIEKMLDDRRRLRTRSIIILACSAVLWATLLAVVIANRPG